METLINFFKSDQSCCVTQLSHTLCTEALSSEFQSQSHILGALPFPSYLVCGSVAVTEPCLAMSKHPANLPLPGTLSLNLFQAFKKVTQGCQPEPVS